MRTKDIRKKIIKNISVKKDVVSVHQSSSESFGHKVATSCVVHYMRLRRSHDIPTHNDINNIQSSSGSSRVVLMIG